MGLEKYNQAKLHEFLMSAEVLIIDRDAVARAEITNNFLKKACDSCMPKVIEEVKSLSSGGHRIPQA